MLEIPLRHHIRTQGNPKFCLAFAKDILQRCAEDHDCYPHNTKVVPKRLLDLSQDSTVRVVETLDSLLDAEYAALSYCWGDDSQIRSKILSSTTRDLEAHKHCGIELSQLPVVFRDAIEVTKHLSLRYLWIDALCIAQGDREEWETESVKMADVYSKAYVTLAASASTSSNQSFLNVDQYRHWRQGFEIKGSEVQGKCSKVFVRWSTDIIPVLYLALSGTNRKKMDTRAWTLGEVLLSPRVLTFEHDRVVFSCKQGQRAEDGVLGTGYHHAVLNLKDILTNFRQYEKDSSDTIVMFESLWGKILEQYTARQATSADDRLPAIAGIASTLSDLMSTYAIDNEYLAGLWRKSFVRELCWTHLHRNRHLAPKLDSCKAPSWSWASVQGAILSGLDARFHDYQVTEYSRLIDASLSVGNAGSFGQIESGEIVLEGPSAQMMGAKTRSNYDTLTVFQNGTLVELPGSTILLDDRGKNAEPIPGFFLDVERRSSMGDEGYIELRGEVANLLFLASRATVTNQTRARIRRRHDEEHDDEDEKEREEEADDDLVAKDQKENEGKLSTAYALLLVQVNEHEERYRRVGIACYNSWLGSDIFKNFPRRRFTVI